MSTIPSECCRFECRVCRYDCHWRVPWILWVLLTYGTPMYVPPMRYRCYVINCGRWQDLSNPPELPHVSLVLRSSVQDSLALVAPTLAEEPTGRNVQPITRMDLSRSSVFSLVAKSHRGQVFRGAPFVHSSFRLVDHTCGRTKQLCPIRTLSVPTTLAQRTQVLPRFALTSILAGANPPVVRYTCSVVRREVNMNLREKPAAPAYPDAIIKVLEHLFIYVYTRLWPCGRSPVITPIPREVSQAVNREGRHSSLMKKIIWFGLRIWGAAGVWVG